jgi:hypothetical protein
MRSMIWSAVLVHLKGRALAFHRLDGITFDIGANSRAQSSSSLNSASRSGNHSQSPLNATEPIDVGL